jgi:hypothetical protein
VKIFGSGFASEGFTSDEYDWTHNDPLLGRLFVSKRQTNSLR